MPRPRKPDSLEQLCINFIVRTEQLWERADIVYLTVALTEKLVDAVLKRIAYIPDDDLTRTARLWFRFEHSKFVGAQVNHMYYESWLNCVPTGLSLMWNNAPQRCVMERLFFKFLQSSNNLIELNLSAQMSSCNYNIGLSIFHKCVLNKCDLSKLQMLDMSDPYIYNETVEFFGTSCPNLRELRLQECKGFDDDTVKVLIKEDSAGQCSLRHLKVLDVRDTSVSHCGVQHILECIPTITHLYHPHVIPVALKLLKCGTLTAPLHLKTLEIRGLEALIFAVEQTEDVSLDLSAFPNVTDLVIYLIDAAELKKVGVFHPLKKLTKLNIREAAIDNGFPFFYEFSNGYFEATERFPFEPLLGLLQNVGSSLYELHLGNVSAISFLAIGQSCPNLGILNANFLYIKAESNVADLQLCFQKVRSLELVQCDLEPPNMICCESDKLFLGLLSPMHRLQYLKLSGIELGNRFLLNVLLKNPLADLEVLELYISCGMKSAEMLLFIESCAKLRKIEIGPGFSYTTQHSKIFQKVIKDHGWDVECVLYTDGSSSSGEWSGSGWWWIRHCFISFSAWVIHVTIVRTGPRLMHSQTDYIEPPPATHFLAGTTLWRGIVPYTPVRKPWLGSLWLWGS